jgi:glycosyltransferase involved in cell wall biosynthesis
MRILVVNPALVRLNNLGACEQDRMYNVVDLARLGHEVHLLTGFMAYQQRAEVEQYYRQRGIEATVVPIAKPTLTWQRFTRPAYLDGAAWEYARPDFLRAVRQVLDSWKPALVWCHATYNWGAAMVAYQQDIPAVVRSVNYEPEQLLHETGHSVANRIRYFAKVRSEQSVLHYAAVTVAITPDEQRLYQQMNLHACVKLLPLRALPHLLHAGRAPRQQNPLRVFFMAASYNVSHNAAGLRFVVEELVPRIRVAAPGVFEFHIMGSKAPQAVLDKAAFDLIFDGYVPDIGAHLETMDIAIAPSLSGAGMQQKVFEPLCRAFPTITHLRALAGYPFEDGVHLLTAEDAEGYTQQILRLRDPALRAQLSARAAEQTAKLFSPARYTADLSEILEAAIH